MAENAGIEGFTGPKTEVIDLGGAFVMPGIIDMHIHGIEGELPYAYDCLFPIQFSVEDIAKAIEECAGEGSDEPWITGGFFMPDLIDDYDGPLRCSRRNHWRKTAHMSHPVKTGLPYCITIHWLASKQW